MRLERYLLIVLLSGLLLASCEKKERPIVLPPAGTAQLGTVTMGEDYQDQVFFDLESGTSVFTSKVNSWDLAFEAGPVGYHVFVNGGKNIFVYNTHASDASSFVAESDVNEDALLPDAACGLPDSTAIGEWRDLSGHSKNEVYIIQMGDKTYRKIVIRSVTNTEYVLAYGDLSSTDLQTIVIPKDNLYNYSYFSFDNSGALVNPEPPKDTWDIVFTRYRYIYHELDNFPYIVSGALLNPYLTTARVDSLTNFEDIGFDNGWTTADFSDHRDVIGFNWKQYNFTTGKYQINPAKSYVIKNRKNQYWKLHFLDFYNASGVKGTPSFEIERIQ